MNERHTMRHSDARVWVRDAISVRRVVLMQTLVLFAMWLWSCYALGVQFLQNVIAENALPPEEWRQRAIATVSQSHVDSLWDCWWYGAMYLLPLTLVIIAVAAGWEWLAACLRPRLPQPDVCVHAWLLALLLPVLLPLQWVLLCVLLMMAVREWLLGYQRLRLHPVAVGYLLLALLFVLGVHDGALFVGIDAELATLPEQLSWWDLLLGESSTSAASAATLIVLVSGLGLLAAGIYSWRVVVGALTGLIVTVLASQFFARAAFALPWYWYPLVGDTAFVIFFIAADPLCAASTRGARWSAGLTVGVVTALLRLFTACGASGPLLAVVAGNLLSFGVDAIHLRLALRRRRNQCACALMKNPATKVAPTKL